MSKKTFVSKNMKNTKKKNKKQYFSKTVIAQGGTNILPNPFKQS